MHFIKILSPSNYREDQDMKFSSKTKYLKSLIYQVDKTREATMI